jgi:hypothetical protein
MQRDRTQLRARPMTAADRQHPSSGDDIDACCMREQGAKAFTQVHHALVSSDATR